MEIRVRISALKNEVKISFHDIKDVFHFWFRLSIWPLLEPLPKITLYTIHNNSSQYTWSTHSKTRFIPGIPCAWQDLYTFLLWQTPFQHLKLMPLVYFYFILLCSVNFSGFFRKVFCIWSLRFQFSYGGYHTEL